MTRSRIPQRGDIYWVDPNPVKGREMKNMHPFVVITVKEINRLGVSITVPITTAGNFARDMGLAVVISGYQTNGVAICNQVRSFDLQERVRQGTAKYIESLDDFLVQEIVDRVVSVIDPEDLQP